MGIEAFLIYRAFQNLWQVKIFWQKKFFYFPLRTSCFLFFPQVIYILIINSIYSNISQRHFPVKLGFKNFWKRISLNWTKAKLECLSMCGSISRLCENRYYFHCISVIAWNWIKSVHMFLRLNILLRKYRLFFVWAVCQGFYHEKVKVWNFDQPL